MLQIIRGSLSPNSSQIERLFGADMAEGIARKTEGWPGPPTPILGTGLVVGGDGDYHGRIWHGGLSAVSEFAKARAARILRNAALRSMRKAHTGFSSLSDAISEATQAGKLEQLHLQKLGATAPAASASMHLWKRGDLPQAGANSAAAPGGTVPGRATTGGFQQTDPGGSDTLHLMSALVKGSLKGALMLSDFLFGVNINHATTANAITGVPTRYQGTNAAGTFLTGLVTTVLGATAHNITVTYVDQDGNVAEAGSAQAIRVSSAVDEIPFTAPKWFYGLNGADRGIRNITNIALSAASTGNVDWQLLHKLAIIPINDSDPIPADFLNSLFGPIQVQANACLVLSEYWKSVTTAANYGGTINVCAG